MKYKLTQNKRKKCFTFTLSESVNGEKKQSKLKISYDEVKQMYKHNIPVDVVIVRSCILDLYHLPKDTDLSNIINLKQQKELSNIFNDINEQFKTICE